MVTYTFINARITVVKRYEIIIHLFGALADRISYETELQVSTFNIIFMKKTLNLFFSFLTNHFSFNLKSKHKKSNK